MQGMLARLVNVNDAPVRKLTFESNRIATSFIPMEENRSKMNKKKKRKNHF